MPDGLVNVGDVVLMLRYSVELDVPNQTEVGRGNVAPAMITGVGPEIVTPIGKPRQIDIGDVVLTLRIAVDLAETTPPT
jgi:hypothetical protein